MKSKSKNSAARINKYDISILLLVVFTAIFIAGVWIWFGHKNAQIERELNILHSSIAYSSNY